MIDSPSFPVFLRLFFASIASGGLYFLAYRNRAAGFETTPQFFAIWAGLFLLYGIAIRAVRGKSGRTLAVFVFVTSTLFRASFLFAPAESRDAFLHGQSPIRALLEVSPEIGAIAALAFDLGGLLLVPVCLRAHSLPTGLALVFGWNPLLVKEGGSSGRLEVIPLFFLLLASLLLQKKRPGAAALSYGLSLAGPPLFGATLLLAVRALGARLAISLLVGGLAWAPLAAKSSIGALAGWPPGDFVGGSLMPAASTLAKLFVTRDPLAPYLLCAAAFLLLSLLRMRKLGADSAAFPRESLAVLGGLLLLAPQVMPWAFVPVAGLAAFHANPGWIVATATAPLTYLALGEGSWSFWLAFAQYFPVYASLGFAALEGKGSSGKAGKAKSERLPRAPRKR